MERTEPNPTSAQASFREMFVDYRNEFKVRQGIQVLVFLKLSIDISVANDELSKMAGSFARMYKDDYMFDGEGVQTYALRCAKDKEIDKAVDFVSRAFVDFLKKQK